mmetsp:Transcript_6271/g.12739  ORF Transcript_6271/g.12739 Transcript_6271/m.12739 type:complete len:305 (+) Transcript_6271:1800-2714(+)
MGFEFIICSIMAGLENICSIICCIMGLSSIWSAAFMSIPAPPSIPGIPIPGMPPAPAPAPAPAPIIAANGFGCDPIAPPAAPPHGFGMAAFGFAGGWLAAHGFGTAPPGSAAAPALAEFAPAVELRAASIDACIMGSCTSVYMRRNAWKPPGWFSSCDIARSWLRIICCMAAGLRAISIVCRIRAGSLSTWLSCGFASSTACICGLLMNMLRIISGLSIRFCIMGEFMIDCIISGFCMSCCCMRFMSGGPPMPPPCAIIDASGFADAPPMPGAAAADAAAPPAGGGDAGAVLRTRWTVCESLMP